MPSEYTEDNDGLFEQAVESRPELFRDAVNEVDRVTREELIGEALALAERAESKGFDSAWVPEHHFTRDGWLTSPLPLAAALATRTDELEIGTAIALAPLYEPMRIAEDAVTVDLINRAGGGSGSFTLGLGLGFIDEEYSGYGVDRKKRVAILQDVIDTCRAAWADGYVPAGGRTVDYGEVNVTPKPGPETKLIAGGFSRGALERTARKADGYIAPQSMTPAEIAENLEVIRSVLNANDRQSEDFDVYVLRYGLPHADGEEAAWETMKQGFLFDQIRHIDWVNESADVDSSYPNAAALFEDWENLLEQWRDWTICGTPEKWIDELDEFTQLWGGDIHVISQFHYPGMSLQQTESAIELFGENVIPGIED